MGIAWPIKLRIIVIKWRRRSRRRRRRTYIVLDYILFIIEIFQYKFNNNNTCNNKFNPDFSYSCNR